MDRNTKNQMLLYLKLLFENYTPSQKKKEKKEKKKTDKLEIKMNINLNSTFI